MNAIRQAQNAYRHEARPVRTHRGNEYEAIARITSRLKSAEMESAAEDVTALASAVHDNRRLWSVFTIEMADDANPLPQELRARILSLAHFVERFSSQVLAGTASAVPLVDINMAIMRGLRDGSIEK